MSYFHKSPMAYLVDSITKASTGTRTAPDWWQDLKRAERQELEMSVESQRVFTQIRQSYSVTLLNQVMRQNAVPLASEHRSNNAQLDFS